MSRDSTERRFYRSTVAATLSQVWRVAVTLGTRIVLRRLVEPADWGVWDWALALFLVLGALRDLGLVYHVVRVRPRPYGNLLAVEGIWGGALALVTVLGAPILALAFHEPHPAVVPVLRWLALFLFLEGMAAVPRTYFECELEIGRVVVPELVRNLLFAGLSLGLAWMGWGVWSLVAAYTTGTGVYAAMLWWRARGRMPLTFLPGHTLPMLRRSLPLALIWFLIILIHNVDPLILGWRFAADIVGNYKFAYEGAFMAVTVLQPAVARALYPALAALSDKPHKLFEAYRLATLLLSSIEVPAALFFFLNAETAVRILGGSSWEAAPGFLRILALAPLVDPFTRLGGELLKVHDDDRWWILSSLLTLGSFAFVGWWATGAFGPHGMAWVNFLPLGVTVMAWALYRIDPPGFSRLARDLAWIYLPAVVPFVLAWWIAGDRLWLRFGLCVGAALLCLAHSYRRFGHSFVAFLRDPRAEAEAAAAQG
ncbi:MAG: oligosaccharide flippase family protein [Thermoanaerobaculia bacterium]